MQKSMIHCFWQSRNTRVVFSSLIIGVLVSDLISHNLNSYEGDISLLNIVDFLNGSWKKLAIASIIGLILGLGGWWLFGTYTAEYTLLNNTNTNNTNNINSNSNSNSNSNTSNTYGLDLLTWKVIQKSLPNLAAQIVEDGKVPNGQVRLYRTLSDDQWWQKNAIPSYALSKADTKDLAGISKEFDGASTTILSVSVKASGSSKEGAIDAVRGAAQFLRSGGAYLQIRSLLNAYEGEVISAAGEIQRKMTATQIEMGYQQRRAKSLEELYRRYPGNSSVGQQVVDPKESGAKYLSITTQIIAANNDINQSKETLSRMDDRLAQLALTKLFLDEALPKIEATFDGLVLDKELLEIEAKLREKIGKDDPKQQEILDQIRSQLVIIQARFTKGLEANTSPTSNGKKGVIISIVGGLAGGLLSAVLLLLGQKIWFRAKRGSAS